MLALRKKPCANVAQLVEQLTRNEQVTGSSPVVGSTKSKGRRISSDGLFLCWRPTTGRTARRRGRVANRLVADLHHHHRAGRLAQHVAADAAEHAAQGTQPAAPHDHEVDAVAFDVVRDAFHR